MRRRVIQEGAAMPLPPFREAPGALRQDAVIRRPLQFVVAVPSAAGSHAVLLPTLHLQDLRAVAVTGAASRIEPLSDRAIEPLARGSRQLRRDAGSSSVLPIKPSS